MKNILITGSSGVVGRYLIYQLRNNSCNQYSVYAASSSNQCEDVANIHFIKNDQIEHVLEQIRIDILVQLAFPRNVSNHEWASGFEFVTRVLILAKKHGVKKIINVSSQSIYGLDRLGPATEESDIVLSSQYTTGKYFSECICNELFNQGDYVNLRMATLIGVDSKEKVANKLITQIINDNEITVKDGAQLLSFLDIRDAVDGLIRMIHANVYYRSVYNLGTNEFHSLDEIVYILEKIARKYGIEFQINRTDEKQQINNTLNNSAMLEDFGWSAQYELEESLEYIFDEYYKTFNGESK